MIHLRRITINAALAARSSCVNTLHRFPANPITEVQFDDELTQCSEFVQVVYLLEEVITIIKQDLVGLLAE